MKVKTNIRGGLKPVNINPIVIDYPPPPSLGGGCRNYP